MQWELIQAKSYFLEVGIDHKTYIAKELKYLTYQACTQVLEWWGSCFGKVDLLGPFGTFLGPFWTKWAVLSNPLNPPAYGSAYEPHQTRDT